MFSIRERAAELGMAVNAVFLVVGYYYLRVIKAQIPDIVSTSKLAFLQFWGSMLYIVLVLLLVSLIIQVIIYVGKFLAVKLGFES